MTDIAQIISLAGQGAGSILTATQIVDNIQKVFGGRKPDLVAAEKLLLQLYKKLNEAERNQMSMERLLAELQKQLDAADQFTDKAARYELATTDMGGRVYALKKGDSSGEPSHEVCANCYAESEIRILQFATSKRNTLACPRCKGEVLKDDGRGSGIAVAALRSSPFDGY